MNRSVSEEQLNLTISYILIVGVVVSIVVEVVGLINYYSVNPDFSISFQPQNELKGEDFFTFSRSILYNVIRGNIGPFQILALGIVLLMITPYLRVLASVVYFGLVGNTKYLVITAFVLVILTASLIVH